MENAAHEERVRDNDDRPLSVGTSLTDNGGPLSGTTGGVVNGLAGAVTLSTSRLPLRQNSAPVPTTSGAGGGYAAVAPPEAANLEVLEYPFLTMTSYPPGFIVHLGAHFRLTKAENPLFHRIRRIWRLLCLNLLFC